MRIFTKLALLGLIACGAQDKAIEAPIAHSVLPPLTKQFECLPDEAAIIAAHRGTAYDTAYAENSISGLKALIDKGYLMAEVDIAGLKDGTHILYHDGVWDEKSTGNGAVASSTWGTAQNYLLNDPRGILTSDTPPRLTDFLDTAKDKIYLEIDFKSSAKYDHVIELIREKDMADQVILISYSKGQADKLARLAPEMMLSISVDKPEDALAYNSRAAVWLGDDIFDDNRVAGLAAQGTPILGRIQKKWSKKAAKAAHVLVTDYTFDHRPIAGLNAENKAIYEACLKN